MSLRRFASIVQRHDSTASEPPPRALKLRRTDSFVDAAPAYVYEGRRPSLRSTARSDAHAEFQQSVADRLESYQTLSVSAALLAGFCVSAILDLEVPATSTLNTSGMVIFAALLCWALAGGLNLFSVIMFTMQHHYGVRLKAYATSLEREEDSITVIEKYLGGTVGLRVAGVRAFLWGVPFALLGLLFSILTRFPLAFAWAPATITAIVLTAVAYGVLRYNSEFAAASRLMTLSSKSNRVDRDAVLPPSARKPRRRAALTATPPDHT